MTPYPRIENLVVIFDTIRLVSNALSHFNLLLKLYSPLYAIKYFFPRILCPTLGEPKAKVTWSRKGSQPGDLETNPLVTFGAGGLEMIIRNIPRSLAGVYQCTADNAFGTDVKKSIVNVAGIIIISYDVGEELSIQISSL